jgi:hypothetical protein
MARQASILSAALLLLACGCAEHSAPSSPPAFAIVSATAQLRDPAPQVEDPGVELEWDELEFELDHDRFDVSQLPKRIRDLEGEQIRIRGYMFFDVQGGEFLLVGEVNTPGVEWKKCFEDPTSTLFRLMAVKMADGQTAEFTQEPIAVEGRLAFDLVELHGQPVLVYRLVGESIEIVKPRDGYRPALFDGC